MRTPLLITILLLISTSEVVSQAEPPEFNISPMVGAVPGPPSNVELRATDTTVPLGGYTTLLMWLDRDSFIVLYEIYPDGTVRRYPSVGMWGVYRGGYWYRGVFIADVVGVHVLYFDAYDATTRTFYSRSNSVFINVVPSPPPPPPTTRTTTITVVTTTRVNNPPTVSISVVNTNVRVGELVSFSITASDPDGDPITSYEIDYGDGNRDTLSSPQSSHAYGRDGVYRVSVRAKDSRGAWSSWSYVTLTVSRNSPPQAQIVSIEPNPSVEGEKVRFEGGGNDPDGTVVEYEWSTGGGAILSSSRTFEREFEPGVYEIRFRVRDNEGAWSGYATQSIRVYSKPVLKVDVVDRGSEKPIRGAEVYIDGRYTGKTGEHGMFEVKVEPGSHTLRVVCEGYTEYEDTLSVSRSENPVEVRVRLEKREEPLTLLLIAIIVAVVVVALSMSIILIRRRKKAPSPPPQA